MLAGNLTSTKIPVDTQGRKTAGRETEIKINPPYNAINLTSLSQHSTGKKKKKMRQASILIQRLLNIKEYIMENIISNAVYLTAEDKMPVGSIGI